MKVACLIAKYGKPYETLVNPPALQMANTMLSSGVAGSKNGGGQNVDFRRATVFCLGYRLLKPKMTTYAKNLGSHGPLPTSMMLGEAVKDKLSLVPLYNDAVSS